MSGLIPVLYERLQLVFSLLEDINNDQSTKHTIERLNDLIQIDDDGTVSIEDRHASSFREALSDLILLLKKQVRHNFADLFGPLPAERRILMNTNLRNYLDTLESARQPNELEYLKSQTLQEAIFSSNPGLILMEILAIREDVGRETGNPDLSLTAIAKTLEREGKIAEQSEDFWNRLATLDQDSHRDNTEPVEAVQFATPDDLVEHILEENGRDLNPDQLETLVNRKIMDRQNSSALRDSLAKNGSNISLYLRTASAYSLAYSDFQKLIGKDDGNSTTFVHSIQHSIQSAEEQYPGINLSPLMLLKILKFTGQIEGPYNEYHSAILASELFRKSSILNEIKSDDTVKPEALIPRLITLLPYIRAEVGDENLTLAEVVSSLELNGRLSPPTNRFFEAAAIFDLYNHEVLQALDPKSFKLPSSLATVIIDARMDIRGYERVPIKYIINVLRLMGRISPDRYSEFLDQARAYDNAFRRLAELKDDDDSLSNIAIFIRNLQIIIHDVLAAYRNRSSDIEITYLNLTRHLIATGQLDKDSKAALVAASTADLYTAFALQYPDHMMGFPTNGTQSVPPRSSTPPSISTAPNLDRYARYARPFLRNAAAQDFCNLFLRQLDGEDLKDKSLLAVQLADIRKTLEGYEHEPLTTFVYALAEIRMIKDDIRPFLRHAAAYDLFLKFAQYMETRDYATPASLIAKLAEIRSTLPDHENVPLVVFVEALVELEAISNEAEPFFAEAKAYEIVHGLDNASDGNDPENGSSAPNSSGGGLPPASAPSGFASSSSASSISGFYAPQSQRLPIAAMAQATPWVTWDASSATFTNQGFGAANPVLGQSVFTPALAAQSLNPAIIRAGLGR